MQIIQSLAYVAIAHQEILDLVKTALHTVTAASVGCPRWDLLLGSRGLRSSAG